MKKLHLVSVAVASCLFLGGLAGCSRETKPAPAKRVRIVYIAPHELIGQIVDGFRAQLTKEMGASVEIFEKHANGDTSQMNSTVSAVLGAGVDLVAPITTPIAQITVKQAPKGLPVLFLGITDSVGAGIVDSIERPGRSTGVSDVAPFEAVLALVRELVPEAKTIGLPFSPDEQPAVFAKNELSRLAPLMGMTLVAQAVPSKDELPAVLRQLTQSSDVLVIGSDNAMFEAAAQIVKAGLDARKPTFAADSTSVKAGAIGAYTIDYREVGVEGGKMAARILRGESAATMPVFVMKTGVLELNLSSAGRLGIQVPAAVIARAKNVIR